MNPTSDQGNTGSSRNFPLDNLAYDLMMIITKKSKSLEAINKYIEDARSNQRVKDSLEKIRKQDEEDISELTRHLSFLIARHQSTGQNPEQSATGGGASR